MYMEVFRVIIYVLVGISILYSAYYVVMGFGFVKKKKKIVTSDKNNKFAIVIAARDEEFVIGNLLDSLKKQSYPKEFYDVFVVVNNCTDNTEGVSLKHGANVIKCVSAKSKGDVLKFTFEELGDRKDIDAYVIFDADNVVHKDFLSKANDMLNSGYNVAQGFRDTKNISDNWITSSYAILYYLQSLFMNQSRYSLGKSSFLNGTGFVIKKEVIDKYGFSPKTVTEDIEFTAMCAINDEKIGFMKDAITYDEQVTSFRSSIKQRKRWSFGAMECLRNYFPLLIRKGIKEKRFECFDVAMFFLAVIIHVLFNVIQIGFLIKMIINIDKISMNSLLIWGILLVLIYLLGVIFRVIILKKYGKSIKNNIGGILLFDLFVFSWLPVNFICLFIKSCNWERIVHNRDVKLENI